MMGCRVPIHGEAASHRIRVLIDEVNRIFIVVTRRANARSLLKSAFRDDAMGASRWVRPSLIFSANSFSHGEAHAGGTSFSRSLLWSLFLPTRFAPAEPGFTITAPAQAGGTAL